MGDRPTLDKPGRRLGFDLNISGRRMALVLECRWLRGEVLRVCLAVAERDGPKGAKIGSRELAAASGIGHRRNAERAAVRARDRLGVLTWDAGTGRAPNVYRLDYEALLRDQPPIRSGVTDDATTSAPRKPVVASLVDRSGRSSDARTGEQEDAAEGAGPATSPGDRSGCGPALPPLQTSPPEAGGRHEAEKARGSGRSRLGGAPSAALEREAPTGTEDGSEAPPRTLPLVVPIEGGKARTEDLPLSTWSHLPASERRIARKEHRRANGLCVKCGNALDPERDEDFENPGTTYLQCEPCREAQRTARYLRSTPPYYGAGEPWCA